MRLSQIGTQSTKKDITIDEITKDEITIDEIHSGKIKAGFQRFNLFTVIPPIGGLPSAGTAMQRFTRNAQVGQCTKKTQP